MKHEVSPELIKRLQDAHNWVCGCGKSPHQSTIREWKWEDGCWWHRHGFNFWKARRKASWKPVPPVSVAYSYPCNAKATVLQIANCAGQFGLVTQLALMTNVKGGKLVPAPIFAPSFWIIGTDRKAIKKLLCEKVEELFKALSVPVPGDAAHAAALKEAIRRIGHRKSVTLCPATATFIRMHYGNRLQPASQAELIRTGVWARVGKVKLRLSQKVYDL